MRRSSHGGSSGADLVDMVEGGLVMVLTAAGLLGYSLLLGTPMPDGDDWVARYGQAYRQFANVAVLAALSVGFPLIVAGLVHRRASLPIGLATWALATATGVGGSVRLWHSQPSFRLDPAFWDEEAQIGSGTRRRSVALLSTALMFVLLVGGLLLAAT